MKLFFLEKTMDEDVVQKIHLEVIASDASPIQTIHTELINF